MHFRFELKMQISSSDRNFCSFLIFFLHVSGKLLSALPVDPKLGKMLVMGALFCCFDPILTIVSALSVRDPFLLPQDKKDVSYQLQSILKESIFCYFCTLSSWLLHDYLFIHSFICLRHLVKFGRIF